MLINLSKNKDKQNILSIGGYRVAIKICDSLIKSFGSVFVYVNSGKIWHVFLFYIIYSLVQAMVEISLVKFLSKKPKLALFFRIFPFIMMYALFFVSITPIYFTILIGIANGLTNAFCLAPLNRISGAIGNSTSPRIHSYISIIEYVGALIMAIISGYLLDSVDTKIIALIGMGLYIIFTLTFMYCYTEDETQIKIQSGEITELEKLNLKQIKENKKFSLKKYNPLIAEGLIGCLTLLDILWPVFIYQKYGTFASVGLMNACYYIGAVIGSYVIGKISVKHSWSCLVIICILLSTIIWIIRPFINSTFILFLLNMLIGFGELITYIALNSVYFAYYKDYKDRGEKLIHKDGLRRLVSVPLSFVFVGSLSLRLPIMLIGGVYGLLSLQIIPAHNVVVNKHKDFVPINKSIK